MCSGAGVEGNAVYSVRSSKYALLTLTKTLCSGPGVEGNALCWPCLSLQCTLFNFSKHAILPLTKTLCSGAGVEGNALAAEDAHQADLGEELPGPRIRD